MPKCIYKHVWVKLISRMLTLEWALIKFGKGNVIIFIDFVFLYLHSTMNAKALFSATQINQ